MRSRKEKKGNLNIRLTSINRVEILVFNYKKELRKNNSKSKNTEGIQGSTNDARRESIE